MRRDSVMPPLLALSLQLALCLCVSLCSRAAFAQSSPGATLDGFWELLSGPVDPTQTANARAIHDARRHRMVLVNGDNFHELWQLSLPAEGGLSWRRVRVGGAEVPQARYGCSAVLDSLRDRVLVFGGAYAADPTNEVWSLSLGDTPTWTRITPHGEPPAGRAWHVAMFDPSRDRMVIFGGAVMPDYAGERYFDDTWALELSGDPTWVRIALAGPAPYARKGASAVYDPWNDRMVLFGGWNGTFFRDPLPIFDDTWTLSLADPPQWARLDIPAPLWARQDHVAVVDPVARRMLVSGGSTWQWFNFTNDTWALPLAPEGAGTLPAWSQLPTFGGNPATAGHAALYSPERGTVLQFGGQSAGNECSELDLESLRWSGVNANAPDTFPSRRDFATLLADRDGSHLLVFGGLWWGGPSDLWSFDLGPSHTWHPVPTVGVPHMSGDHNFVFDPVRNRLLAFGNTWNGTFQAGEMEVMQMGLEEPRQWTPVEQVGDLPPRREEFSLVYDAKRDRVLLFGGVFYQKRSADLPTDKDDLWSFSLSSRRWTRLNTVNSPGARRRHWAGYDAAHDRMLVVGGSVSGYRTWGSKFDCWALPLASDSLRWSPLGPDAPPLQMGYEAPEMAAAIDPLRDRLLVWDGHETVSALDLAHSGAWTPLTVAGETPAPRSQFGITYDVAGDQVLYLGGFDGSLKGDLQALRLSRPVAVTLLRQGLDRMLQRGSPWAEVAVLADADFSPDSVRTETVSLAGLRPVGHDAPGIGGEPVWGRGAGAPWTLRRDVNGDGRVDLVLRFPADSLGLALRDDAARLRARTTRFEILARLPRSPAAGRPGAGGPGPSAGAIQLSPRSPAHGAFAIRYRLPSSDPARLEVFDLAGRRVWSRTLKAEAGGDHELVLDRRGLRAGVYLARLAQGPEAVVARIVLLP